MPYKIYLYDTEVDCIGTGMLSSAYVQSQLQLANGDDVDVHISSVGGSAFDAIAIYDLLKKHPGKVTTYVDALAASAASVVAMAGQMVVMSKYALLMIHKPMVGSGGNADELLKDVQMLNTVQTRLAAIYMDKTGLDEVTINSFINSVTWMTADQALDLGFIDAIEDYEPEITNSALIKKYTGTAPALYQRCINKILNTKTSDMNTENKDLIEKTTSVLDKVMNFLKKVVGNKLVTNNGDLHMAYGATLAEGVEVFNDADLTTPAADGTRVYNKKKVTIKAGKVEKMEDDDEDGDTGSDDDDDQVENKVLNDAGIKVTAKGSLDVKNVAEKITDIKNQLDAQNKLLAEAQNALKDANARLEKTREEVKNEIKSDFTPDGSKRSTKTAKEQVAVKDGASTHVVNSAAFVEPTSEAAKNLVKRAVYDQTQKK